MQGKQIEVSPIRPQRRHRAPVDANKPKEEDEERSNYPAKNESPQHGRGFGKKSSVRKNWVKEGVAQTPLHTTDSHITLSPFDCLHQSLLHGLCAEVSAASSSAFGSETLSALPSHPPTMALQTDGHG